MKLRILLFFTLLSLGLNAQTSQPQASGNTNTFYTYLGGYGYEKGLRLPNGTSSFLFPNVVNKKGFIQYNTELNLPQFYNGTTWITFGGNATVPTLQQVLNAGSTANITSPFIINYKTGTPQAVELSINDSNLQLGLAFYNNYLIFDDSQAIFNRNLSVPDAVNNNHAVNLGQLNSAFGSFVPYSGATDNVNLGDNNLIANSIQTKTISLFDAESENQKIINLGAAGLASFALPTTDGTGTIGATKGGTTIYTGTDGLLNLDNLGLGETLDQVTTNGNITTNPITTGGLYVTDGSTTALVADETGALRTNAYLQFQNSGQTSHSLTSPATGNYTWGLPASDGTVVNGVIMNGTTYTPNIQGKVTLPNTTSTPTNLSYDAANRQLNNSNGTGVTFPFVTATVPGLASPAIFNHVLATNNPHNVTAAQVGLGNVNNTSDANKPVSTAQQSALDAKFNNPNGLLTDYLNGLGQPIDYNTTWRMATLGAFTPVNAPITQGQTPQAVAARTMGMFNDIYSKLTSNKYTGGFTTITANYTVTIAAFGQNGQLDIYANATSGNITITLPGATNMAGYSINVIKTDNTANSVTISGGTTNINQSTTYPLTTINQNVTVKSDNTQYRLFN